MASGKPALSISLTTGVLLSTLIGPAVANADKRELVEMPPMMQDHMLANMRDHLMAIDEILEQLAQGNVSAAASIAEERLGLSSLSLHGADHMASVIPRAMGEIGTEMHRAASRFAIIVQDAELDEDPNAEQKVYRALQEITENCNACHQSYRVR